MLAYFADQIVDPAEKERAWQRYHAIRRFAESNDCRHRQICLHFGETPKWTACGACDACGCESDWLVKSVKAEQPKLRPPAALVMPAQAGARSGRGMPDLDPALREYLREWRRAAAKAARRSGFRGDARFRARRDLPQAAGLDPRTARRSPDLANTRLRSTARRFSKRWNNSARAPAPPRRRRPGRIRAPPRPVVYDVGSQIQDPNSDKAFRPRSSMSTTIVPAEKSQLTREEINRKQKEYIFPSVSTYYSDPLPMDHASMQHVWDVEGKKYLDFFGGIVTISVGHCNPRVTSRTKEQIDRMQHVSTCFPNVPMVDLAEKLAQITPGALKKSYFTNSGTEANETAIQVARMHTGNFEVVALRHGYSGRSSLTRGLTGMNTWRKGTIEVGIVHAMNPYCYRCPLGLKYPSCEVACAKDIENVIQFSTSGRIAAFLAEPIQGVGGFITPPKEYFKLAFNIVKQYGGDFISDEVQTAWGRTGHKWFGIEHWEVEPDMITAAKGLGNGMPIGLTVAKPEIADSFQGMTISTFGGNPVTSVTARAVIDIIEEDDLRTNAAVVGDYFRKKLEELQAKHATDWRRSRHGADAGSGTGGRPRDQEAGVGGYECLDGRSAETRAARGQGRVLRQCDSHVAAFEYWQSGCG